MRHKTLFGVCGAVLGITAACFGAMAVSAA